MLALKIEKHEEEYQHLLETVAAKELRWENERTYLLTTQK